MDKLNVGFIGCGRISDLHAPGYKDDIGARIYAVCDTDPEILEQRRAEWKAEKTYTDYREMLQDPELDAVEVLSPAHWHEPMTVEALRSGKPVALQKPMTADLESANRVLDAEGSSGILLRVTEPYMFYPPLVLAREIIRNGDIGTPTNLRIKMITGSGGWAVPEKAWEWRLNEMISGRGGFQTFDHGHHLHATAWFLLGEIEKVVAWIDSLDGIVDSPAVIMWKYRDGAKYGSLDYSFSPEMEIPTRYYANDEWFEVVGTRGLVLVHRCTGNILEGPSVSTFTSGGWKHYSDVPSDWVEGFKGATRNFVKSVRGEEKPFLSGHEGREILKFELAAMHSSRLKREVTMDEVETLCASQEA